MRFQETIGDLGMMVVSVDSKSFNRKFLSSSLPFLASQHTKFYLIIADELMVYNKYQIGADKKSLDSLFSQYFFDRKKSLLKIIQSNNILNVEILSYGEFCDVAFSKIFRRFSRLVMSDPDLISALNAKAKWFLEGQKKEIFSNDKREELSSIKAFLVEETAWAIHMASNYMVTDQYYPEDNADFLRHIYQYGRSGHLMQLIGAKEHKHGFWSVNYNNSDKDYELNLEWSAHIKYELPPTHELQ